MTAVGPAVFLMGPTAAGKTHVALELAGRLPVEIVSVDSVQVYRGLDIGTAKPSAAVRARVPHHLVDIAEPEERYSAGRFRQDAQAAIGRIRARGRLPLLVGGTMLYFRALAQGLGPMPPADAGVRAALDEAVRHRGRAALHAELAAVDPNAAERISPNDWQRIQRALEVWRLTGSPISAYQARAPAADERILRIAVSPRERATLHERIDTRFRRMLAAGLVEEVATLIRRPGIRRDLPALRAVGYRQAAAYLAGEIDYDTLVECGIVATRQLAKRQLTWLRGMTDVTWYTGAGHDTLAAIAAQVQGFGEAVAGR